MLHDSFYQSSLAAAQRASKRTDDASGNGRLEPQWISDRDDELTDSKWLRRRQAGIRKRGSLRTQHGKISRGIAADDRRGNGSAVNESNSSILNALDDVLVGQHVAVGRDHDAGAGPAAGASRLLGPSHVNAYYRGADVLDRSDDRARVSIQRLIIFLQHEIRRLGGGRARTQVEALHRFLQNCPMTISLAQTALLLGAAVLAVSLFRLLRLSSILGYVAAGMVIGPWGFGLVHDVPSVMNFAEFGIVLLLFIIGLELQPTRLWVMRKNVFVLGLAQVAICAIALGTVAWLLGLSPGPALLVGFGLSLSSTPLVLQLLAERAQLKSPHGRAAFGILLFQDLAVLPALAALPLVAPHDGPADHTAVMSGGMGVLTVVKLLMIMAAIVIGGRLLLRPALRVVARLKVSEVFTAAALLTVILTALLAQQAGLSMSLGAFLAGVLLADSEFRHELEADLEPFKGLLLGLFFIAVGMAANLGLLQSEPATVLLVTAAFLVIKLLAITALGSLSGQSRRSAWKLGFTLPAGGEFAFVLFTLASRERIIAAETADLLVLAVTLSMMLGPLLLILHDALLARWIAEPPRPFDGIDERENRVIIAGFGRFGQIVARVLSARRIKFTALDSNQTHVDFVRKFGNKVYYGDASRLELLRAAGMENAAIFVLAIDDIDASIRAAELVKQQFPRVKILARARNRQHAFALRDIGVRLIIRETYASSLEMAEAVLASLGESKASARAAVKKFRQHDEATLDAQYAVKEDENKFIATSREAAQQLEKLFEADEVRSE